MRIAYISYEFPPDTAVGGIATYIYQVAKMMKSRGHDVEVFCASPTRSIFEEFENLLVHRVLTKSRDDFPINIVAVFQDRHSDVKFDILESPEFSGDAYEIKKRNPSLPLIVKLHSPSFLLKKLDTYYLKPFDKFRFILGGIIKRDKRVPFWNWKLPGEDIEYLLTSLADQIHSPSKALKDLVAKEWNINKESIITIPNPFIPNNEFLKIPLDTENNTVTFLGRLEYKKGITYLAKAIPLIVKAIPEAKFKIVGKDALSLLPGLKMRKYLELELEQYLDRIEFSQVTFKEIPAVLAKTDVCVFPSLWENFPNVCLEAMCAGRAIVGSTGGGMRDMLEDVNAGILVNPQDSKQIANAVIKLLKDKSLRIKLGQAAREKALMAYNSDVIGDLLEQRYAEVILSGQNRKND